MFVVVVNLTRQTWAQSHDSRDSCEDSKMHPSEALPFPIDWTRLSFLDRSKA
jgi:hypothetical protein